MRPSRNRKDPNGTFQSKGQLTNMSMVVPSSALSLDDRVRFGDPYVIHCYGISDPSVLLHPPIHDNGSNFRLGADNNPGFNIVIR